MIITKFLEQVKQFPNNIAINGGDRLVTYNQLNTSSNQIAHALIAANKESGKNNSPLQVALLFEHGVDMIIAVIGALKANKTYVPMDTNYPEKRLVYILENSACSLILTNRKNASFAARIVDQTGSNLHILSVDELDDQYPDTAIKQERSNDNPAYILYTSGSTGQPKGVVQTSRNILYYTQHWIEKLSLTVSDRLILLSAFNHDAVVPDIFTALLSGACLYPYNMRTATNTYELYTLLIQEKITVWHSVPSLFRFFANTLTMKDRFCDLRWLILGGEPLRAHDFQLFKDYFPNAKLVNIYGQTESTVTSMCIISPIQTFDDVTIGEPFPATNVLLVDENGDLVEEIGVGEIVVNCDHVAIGYWKDNEATEKVFTTNEELGKLYWTGDLGRLTGDGSIKMIGRKDFQVKIRGFRVETGDIESHLLGYHSIKEVVVTAREEDDGEQYLCAYIVTSEPVSAAKLREHLSKELPEYMMPRYFIPLERLPVTPNGKINRNALPEPNPSMVSAMEYEPPSNETEEKLTAIWMNVLEVDRVGINDNFIDLGGQSLLVINLISEIHQQFGVELQLNHVFENPTVKELARLIPMAKKSTLSSIEPAEKNDNYPTTSTQKRMFALNQLEGIGVTYNLPTVVKIQGNLNIQLFEESFKKLIKRHEVLRTTFEMVADEVVQTVHESSDFSIHHIVAEPRDWENGEKMNALINQFIKPFDLSKKPLMRVGFVNTGDSQYLVIIDIHHIITDATSNTILLNDLMSLYLEEELPTLRIQYKDVAVWRNNQIKSGTFQQQEAYWLKQLEGEIPVINLPTDFERPTFQSFEGEHLKFRITKEETLNLKKITSKEDATLVMMITAIYGIMLSKICNQEDIVMGTDVAGRKHPDVQNLVGMFANTVVLRTFPNQEKTFKSFLKEVKEKILNAFDNQEYPFEDLVDRVVIRRDLSRNPIFDAMLSFIEPVSTDAEKNKPRKPGTTELKVTPHYGYAWEISMFDLALNGTEHEEQLCFSFEYSTKLFKRETIQLFIAYFKQIVSSVIKNPNARLWEIEVLAEEQKNELLKSVKAGKDGEIATVIDTNHAISNALEAEFDF